MSQKREHQRQRKAEKTRLKRDEIRKSGKASRAGQEAGRGGVPGKRASTDQAARWPLSECYATGNWHEQGAHVHVVVSRRREDGRIAASFFEIDLAARGVVECKVSTSLNDAMLMSELGRLTDEAGDSAAASMVTVEAGLAARIVITGRDHGLATGHPAPRGLDDALALLDGITPVDTEVSTGTPAAAPEKKKGGLFGWVSSLFRKPDRDAEQQAEIDPADLPTDPGPQA